MLAAFIASTPRALITVAENIVGHAAALVIGFVMMVLGLGVTMIMLPVGLVIGLIGALVFIGGIFGHFAPVE